MLLGVGVASLVLAAFISPVSASPTESLQPASTGGVGQFDSLRVGSQGVGGVTYFNGSIVNSTTGTGGADNPVTFGDNVRIDGGIRRGTSGANDAMPVKINDDLRIDGALWGGSNKGNAVDGQSLVIADAMRPALDNTNNFGSTGYRWKDGYFGGRLAVGDLLVNGSSSINGSLVVSTDLEVENELSVAGDAGITGALTVGSLLGEVVTSGNIVDQTITGDDIASGAITTLAIANDTITTDDLADGSVTPAKIEGTSGTNLPIAYGIVDAAGALVGGTSNLTTSYDGGNLRYNITISDVTYSSTSYVTIVTPSAGGAEDVTPRTAAAGGNLRVIFRDASSGLDVSSLFQFVVFAL